MSYYRSDLAVIHERGFSHLARAAAAMLIDELSRAGHAEGTIVDLGCGGGTTARHLCDAGYDVVGLDLSEAFVEMARRRVPEATFIVGSFVGAELPSCVAVTAIGEVLNYAFDERNSRAVRAELFADVFAALVPGGLFLFDVAGPGRASTEPTRTFTSHSDWVVLVEASADERVLTRRITTFVREDEVYRRDDEVHRLLLAEPDEVDAELRSAGFGVRRIDRYGDTALPAGLHGFVAQKSG